MNEFSMNEQVENINKLTQSVVKKTQQLCPTSPSRKRDAKSVAEKYCQLFTLFGRCHQIYNSARQMDDKDIQELGKLSV